METITLEMKQDGLKMETSRAEFAIALKTWRLRNGMTQRQVADRWGISRYTIIRAEKGRDITWEMAYKLFSKLATELKQE